jgi:hypothetical protein
MTSEQKIETIENNVLIVAVQDSAGGYFIWQKGLTKEVGSEDGVYFEFDDQVNGGYDIVKECTIDTDGIHVVLSNGRLAHFYFPKEFKKYSELKNGLLKVYEGLEHLLEFHI